MITTLANGTTRGVHLWVSRAFTSQRPHEGNARIPKREIGFARRTRSPPEAPWG
jgi:hypothetical protein